MVGPIWRAFAGTIPCPRGNSAVLRRIQSKERPVGWVLLENLLRLQKKDPRIKTIFPEDGVVIQANIMAITKKREKVANLLSDLSTGCTVDLVRKR